MSRNITSGAWVSANSSRLQAVFGDADDAKLGPHLLQQAAQGARENRFVLGDDGSGWRGQGHAGPSREVDESLSGERSVQRSGGNDHHDAHTGGLPPFEAEPGGRAVDLRSRSRTCCRP